MQQNVGCGNAVSILSKLQNPVKLQALGFLSLFVFSFVVIRSERNRSEFSWVLPSKEGELRKRDTLYHFLFGGVATLPVGFRTRAVMPK